LANLVRLPEKGSHLADLTLTRDTDGTPRLTITHMHPRLIETTGKEVPDRIQIICGWVEEGAKRLREEWK
jgi:hypothetical protein